MTDTSKTHELEAVHNGDVYDLKITELATKNEILLRNDGGFDSAWAFDLALEKVLGGKEAVTRLYLRGERPRVSRADVDRIRVARSDSFDH